jgi:uncharacterized membrane protein
LKSQKKPKAMKHKLSRNYLVALTLVTIFCLVTLFVRNAVEKNTTYNFLLWNLFLAFVPLVLAWISYFFVTRTTKLVVVLLTLAWLLFYPNAPYMISDMIHVNAASSMELYDALILFMFAILALFYGFYSLKIIHLVYKTITGKKTAHTIVGAAIVLSSAGIYLGRILRLNSWDLFTQPLQTMKVIFDHLFPVTKNPTTYVVIFLFSIVQFIFLMMMKDLDDIKQGHHIDEQAGDPRLIKGRKPVISVQ